MGNIGEKDKQVKRDLHPMPAEIPQPEHVPELEPEQVPAAV